jgi:hypothetical protein
MSGILLPTGDVVLVGMILICILIDQAIGARLERLFVLRSSNSKPSMSQLGHSRPGRASSKSGHVRYAPECSRNYNQLPRRLRSRRADYDANH